MAAKASAAQLMGPVTWLRTVRGICTSPNSWGTAFAWSRRMAQSGRLAGTGTAGARGEGTAATLAELAYPAGMSSTLPGHYI